jgi:hypothetical protein
MSVKPPLYARGLRYPGDLINRRELQGLVHNRRAPTLALHGHVHAAVQLCHAHLLQIGCSALAEWPHAWTFVELDPHAMTVTVTRRIVRDGNPDVDTDLAPAHIQWRHDGVAWRTADALPHARARRSPQRIETLTAASQLL